MRNILCSIKLIRYEIERFDGRITTNDCALIPAANEPFNSILLDEEVVVIEAIAGDGQMGPAERKNCATLCKDGNNFREGFYS